MSLNTERIRALYAHYGDTNKLKPNTAVQHIRMLLEELDALETGHMVTCEPCQHTNTDPYIPGGNGNHYHRCYETYCEAWEDWTHT